jgi:RNA 2',3'-cyclic 3'-phosphodiesterase
VNAEQARLFVALDLPAPVRDELAAWAAREAGDVELRLIAPEMLHVTLCFLGWRPAAEAERIGELALAPAAPVPDLSAAGAAWLPPRRPRVLAVDLDDPTGAAADLQARVSEALVRGAGYEPERRAWRPHVTVGRVPKRARVRAEDLEPPPPTPFAGAALTLYRSQLRRDGARYTPVARVTL